MAGYAVVLTDTDEKCLDNDLLDIQDWITKAVEGKVYSCKTRLIREWQRRLLNDPNVVSIPTDEDALLALIFAHPDYRNRVQREVAGG